jgi:hypothetical protein
VHSNIIKARLRRWAEEALFEVQYGEYDRGCLLTLSFFNLFLEGEISLKGFTGYLRIA